MPRRETDEVSITYMDFDIIQITNMNITFRYHSVIF